MKLLFTDLDGTLLNNDSVVTAETKSYLDQFIAKGNKLILSSGRPLSNMLEVRREFGFTGKGILLSCSNGTVVYDCDKECIIMEKRLSMDYVNYLQQRAQEYGLHVHTYRDDAIISPADDPEIQFYRRKVHLPLVISPVLSAALDKEPYKMLAVSLDDFEKLEAFREGIADWAEGRIQTIYSNTMYLELFDHSAGKGNAVRFVCNYFNVPLSDAYAAGDAENDISMLEAAGTGIAMANAPDNVKKHADVITELDNDKNGLALTMQKLLKQ